MANLWNGLKGWEPDREFLLGPLRTPRQHRLRLSHFPVGIDHYRIDVCLSTEMRRAASALVRSTLREDVHRYYWRESFKAPDIDAAEAFRVVHVDVTKSLLERGNRKISLGRAQLYQLALIKWLLEAVDEEFERLRDELQHVRDECGARASGHALALHQRMVTLARYESTIRYRTASHVMRIVSRTELGMLRKFRKAVLGVSWPLAERLLFNPLLQLRGLGAEDDFASVYPLVLYDLPAFSQFNQIVLRTLRPWLPDSVRVPEPHLDEQSATATVFSGPAGFTAVESRLRRVARPYEYEPPRSSWLDHWENLTTLLGGTGENWPQSGPWRHRRWRAFQSALRKSLQTQLDEAGLLKPMLATDQLLQLSPVLGVSGQVRLMCGYLTGQISRRDCMRRVEDNPTIKDASELMRRLDAAMRALRRPSRDYQQRAMIRTLGHFARLRRDLKTSWQAMSAMSRLRFAHDPKEQALSSANGLLQEFYANGDEASDTRPVVGHVIVKVDVRGSTQLTASMQKAELNPAAYFSRNLFLPIEGLLRKYNAEKVFIEGDAVILIIHEHPKESDLAVARACGLACNIMRIVDISNGRNRHLGLPELEVGIGIAYESDPPAYLFDGKRRITISSAINRADRLSSCHARLRHTDLRADTAGRGVEVVVPVRSDASEVQWADEIIRYNVNGIEIDVDAFYKLRSELKLHGLALATAGEQRYFAGRYPDAQGKMHWMAVREAPIRNWDGYRLVPNPNDERRFFEVVTDADQLEQLREQLAPDVVRAKGDSKRAVNNP